MNCPGFVAVVVRCGMIRVHHYSYRAEPDRRAARKAKKKGLVRSIGRDSEWDYYEPTDAGREFVKRASQ